jgi:hypothetical protein
MTNIEEHYYPDTANYSSSKAGDSSITRSELAYKLTSNLSPIRRRHYINHQPRQKQ